MNRSRVRQYVQRLNAWKARNGAWIRQQPVIMIEREISVEEAKRLYNFDAHPDAIAVGVGYTVYKPLEMEVDPWPTK